MKRIYSILLIVLLLIGGCAPREPLARAEIERLRAEYPTAGYTSLVNYRLLPLSHYIGEEESTFAVVEVTDENLKAKVREVLAGEAPKKGEVIHLTYSGTYWASSMDMFKEGERYVLFLHPDPDREGYYAADALNRFYLTADDYLLAAIEDTQDNIYFTGRPLEDLRAAVQGY